LARLCSRGTPVSSSAAVGIGPSLTQRTSSWRLRRSAQPGHDHGTGLRRQEFSDRCRLVPVGGFTVGAVGHDLGQLGLDGQFPPGLAGLEGAVGLIVRFLRQKSRGIQFPLQRRPQPRVLGPEFGQQIITVFVDHMIQDFDGVHYGGQRTAGGGC